MSRDPVPTSGKAGGLAVLAHLVPVITASACKKAERRWVEFFTVEMTNDNTGAAYKLALNEFFDWLGEVDGLGDGNEDLGAISAHHVSSCREWLVKSPALVKGRKGAMVERTRTVPTAKLKLAVIRSQFRYLRAGGVIERDPAASVRAPEHSATIGKTAELAA